jgi:hypothetical protein
MKWEGKRKSSNIEDRRGQSPNRGTMGRVNPMLLGTVFRLIKPLSRVLFSKTGLIILSGLLAFFIISGNNPLTFIGQLLGGQTQTVTNTKPFSEKEDALAQFCTTILASTEDIWNNILPNYREPTLVLFSNAVNSACGNASSATGPFYCPGDEKLYIDLSFFQEMEHQLGAPGDFAQAYVIAHEVGHHIQKLQGITAKVDRMRGMMSKTEFNKYSVRLELQADFLAGVWAHHSQQMEQWMETGDLKEAINAANAIGDDRLQKNATGHVVPDSFTHGTSKQRMYWFNKGFQTGDLSKGDTFNALSLN